MELANIISKSSRFLQISGMNNDRIYNHEFYSVNRTKNKDTHTQDIYIATLIGTRVFCKGIKIKGMGSKASIGE